jgi:hypothetical protein
MAPVDKRLQSLVTLRRGGLPSDQQLEAVVEAVDNLSDAEHSESSCRELDREWNASPADARSRCTCSPNCPGPCCVMVVLGVPEYRPLAGWRRRR